VNYWIRPLRPVHCENLAPHVSEEDRRDLLASDYSPETALQSALQEEGEAWAVGLGTDESHVLGAFGWTTRGAIWSMWRPLTLTERKHLLKLAPRFIEAMSADANRLLGNLVCVENEQIIAWLRATGCITLLDTHLTFNERDYVPFIVTPRQGDLTSV
jgi:hypothetical protein